MSKSLSSPTASLLRSSRLFSLPRPLPTPVVEQVTAAGVYRTSDTATAPYPTHQAISTPPSSHTRGDWGFKRQLPQRGTRNKTAVRVRAQDTQTHITDFESAGDHVRTLEKWLEMGIPMVRRQDQQTVSGGNKNSSVSAYEGNVDSTDPHWMSSSLEESGQEQEPTRWKYAGPWVAGMTNAEFSLYLTKNVDGRKAEWREFLREKLTRARYVEAKEAARNNGEAESFNSESQMGKYVPSEQELADFEKGLRDSHSAENLNSDLTRLIVQFLDLPAMRSATDSTKMGSKSEEVMNKYLKNNALRKALTKQLDIGELSAGPPTTHPGAGLSHIRTNAVMENHPVHGPQAYPSPVLSRVLQARTSASGTIFRAKIGVGGVVTQDPITTSHNPDKFNRGSARLQPTGDPTSITSMYDPDKMGNALDLDLKGGNKMFVHPGTASMDENSRITLDVTRGDKEAIAVKTDDVQAIHDAKAASDVGGSGPFGMPSVTGSRGAGATIPKANYGNRLPDLRRLKDNEQYAEKRQAPVGKRRPEIRGFDEELKSREGGGEAARRIREFMEKSRS